MLQKLIVAVFLLSGIVDYAYSWECQKCSDSTNSTCQMGTAVTTLNCTEYDSCYEENIVHGSISSYERGCANWNWCAMQQENHGIALKYCRICQGDKCNNKAFGSSPSKECIKCTGSFRSDCQMGKREDTFTCPTEDESCYEDYILEYGSVKSKGRRGCAPWNWCAMQEKNHGEALRFCRTCRGDKCNNEAFKLHLLKKKTRNTSRTSSLKCIVCDGSENSTCHLGTAESFSSCPPALPSCYEEHIENDGESPLYRRDCGLPDRCTTSAQGNVHGNNLKFCRTCQGDKCNNKLIDGYSLQCISCKDSDIMINGCRDEIRGEWPHCNGKMCFSYKLLENVKILFGAFSTEKPWWIRGCTSDADMCTRENAADCTLCKKDNCNWKAIEE